MYACVAGLTGRRCVREGAPGGTGGAGSALPCLPSNVGEERWQRRGSSSQGSLVTRPAGQAEVAALPAARDGGTDHPEHPPR